MIKNICDFIYDIFHRQWIPFFLATYLSRKKEIRINRDDFISLLNTWEELDNKQRETWVRLFIFHFYEYNY